MLLQCCSRAIVMILALDCFLVEYEEIRVQLALLEVAVVLVVPVGLVLLPNQVVWIRREWSFRSLVEGMRRLYQGRGLIYEWSKCGATLSHFSVSSLDECKIISGLQQTCWDSVLVATDRVTNQKSWLQIRSLGDELKMFTSYWSMSPTYWILNTMCQVHFWI